MKKLVLCAAALVIPGAILLWAQNILPGDLFVHGKVGVGTTNPLERLHVEGNAWISGPGATLTLNNLTAAGQPLLYLRDISGSQLAGRIATNGGNIELAPSNIPALVIENATGDAHFSRKVYAGGQLLGSQPGPAGPAGPPGPQG